MEAFIERGKKRIVLDFSGKISELIEKIGVNVEEVLIVKNGEVVTEEDEVSNEDKVEFLSVVSGG